MNEAAQNISALFHFLQLSPLRPLQTVGFAKEEIKLGLKPWDYVWPMMNGLDKIFPKGFANSDTLL